MEGQVTINSLEDQEAFLRIGRQTLKDQLESVNAQFDHLFLAYNADLSTEEIVILDRRQLVLARQRQDLTRRLFKINQTINNLQHIILVD